MSARPYAYIVGLSVTGSLPVVYASAMNPDDAQKQMERIAEDIARLSKMISPNVSSGRWHRLDHHRVQVRTESTNGEEIITNLVIARNMIPTQRGSRRTGAKPKGKK